MVLVALPGVALVLVDVLVPRVVDVLNDTIVVLPDVLAIARLVFPGLIVDGTLVLDFWVRLVLLLSLALMLLSFDEIFE